MCNRSVTHILTREWLKSQGVGENWSCAEQGAAQAEEIATVVGKAKPLADSDPRAAFW
jgi:hypothetical protein